MIKNKIMFSYLPNPIPLRMFDRSTPSNVNKKVQMLIIFPTGEMHHLELELFVTKLDENYSLVLGYNWLAWYNPSINWTETKITFREPKDPKGKQTSSGRIDICMVSTQTMAKFCRDPGTPTFVILTADLTLPQTPTTGQTAPTEESDPLKNILEEYCNFCNMFSGEKVSTLAPHRSYNLHINIKEGAKPVHGPIYSLSPPELAAL